MSQRALENRVAIITGASRGMGLEISKRYLVAGASVVICARTAGVLDEARLSLEALAGPGQTVLAVPADVSRVEDVVGLVDIALGRLGRIDILVNNAGVYGPKGAIEEIDWREWRRALEINL